MIPKASHVKLTGWRKQKSHDPRRPVKVSLLLLSVGLLSIFGFFVVAPFYRPNLCVVAITPNDTAPLQLASIHELDLAQWLCVANKQAVRQSLGIADGKHASGIHEAVNSTSLLPSDLHSNSTLLVYITGILSIDGNEPGLCNSSVDSIHGGNKLAILELVRRLQKAPCKQVMVCLDVTAPVYEGMGNVLSGVAWQEFRDRVEKQLLSENNTPVAIQFHWSSFEDSPHSNTSSKLSQTIAKTFSSSSLSIPHRLSDLQNELTTATSTSQNFNDQPPSYPWIVTANWPMDDTSYQLPGIKGRSVKAEMAELATSSVVTTKLVSAPEDQDIELQIEDATAEELLSICDALLAPEKSVENSKLAGWLEIPSKQSWEQRSPYAFHTMQQAFSQLRAAWCFNQSNVPLDLIKIFTQCLVRLEQRKVLPTSAPPWIKLLASTIPAPIRSPSRSLVANVMLSQHGLLEYDELPRDRATLMELCELLDKSSTGQEVQKWLDQLPEDQREFSEILWAKAVMDSNAAPWSLQQCIIKAKLLANRLSCVPGDETDGDLQVARGDLARLSAERAFIDQSSEDWREICQQKIDAAIEEYRMYLQQIKRVHQKYDSLQRELSNIRNQTGLESSRAAWQRFSKDWVQCLTTISPDFAQTWQPMFDRSIDDIAQEHPTDTELKRALKFQKALDQCGDALWKSVRRKPKCFDRNSMAWVFLKQLCKPKPAELSRLVADAREPVEIIQHWNQTRLLRERSGATVKELTHIDSELAWWDEVYSKETSNTAAPPMGPWSIRAANDINFGMSGKAETLVELEGLKPGDGPTKLVPKYDSSVLELSLQGRPISDGREIEITPNPDGKTVVRVSSTLRGNRSLLRATPVVFVATRGLEERRAVLRLQGLKQPMAKVTVTNGQPTNNTSVGADQHSVDAYHPLQKTLLLANQTNRIRVELTSDSSDAKTYSCRILGFAKACSDVPNGTLTLEESQKWLQRFGEPLEIATCVPLALAPGQSDSLHLLPGSGLVSQPMLEIDPLLVEIRDDSRSEVQFSSCSFAVTHPSQYIHSQAIYDESTQVVQASIRSMESGFLSKLGSVVDLELLALPELKPVAKTSIRLTPDKPLAQVALSTAACNSRHAILSVSVDGWRPVALYDVSLERSGLCVRNKLFASIQCEPTKTPTATTNIAEPNVDHVEVLVDAFLDDTSLVQAGDCIRVGIDRRGDRSLENDVFVTLSSPRCIRFQCDGVDPDGDLLIQPTVGPHRVKLPVEMDWDRWSTPLAIVHRGDEQIRSNSSPIVFDRRVPRINSVRVMGKQPCLLGAPLSIEVQVDDGGLSGGGLVEGSWSMTGELEFGPQSVALPGVHRQNDRWLLTLPTNNLPSGSSVLLVRARDRAGNVCKAYPLRVELLTQVEIDAREAAKTTLISGAIVFGKSPMPSMKVRLLKQLEKLEPASSNAKKQESEIEIGTAVTDTNGNFLLNGISSGSYTLEATGIVQGMREKRSQVLTVNASAGPQHVFLRWDKKP